MVFQQGSSLQSHLNTDVNPKCRTSDWPIPSAINKTAMPWQGAWGSINNLLSFRRPDAPLHPNSWPDRHLRPAAAGVQQPRGACRICHITRLNGLIDNPETMAQCSTITPRKQQGRCQRPGFDKSLVRWCAIAGQSRI